MVVVNGGGIIVCGPNGFRLQGEVKVSINGIEVFSDEKLFQVSCRDIDRLVLISPQFSSSLPASVGSSVQSSVGGSSNQRRYLASHIPPTWYTVGISTKAFLFYEFSVPTRSEQELIYKALSDYTKLPTPSWSDHKLEDFHVVANGWKAFSPQGDFAEEIAAGICRVSHVNANYQVCASYPECVVVPRCVDDDVIVGAAACRHGRRFPVIKYFHANKSTFLATAGELTALNRSSNKANTDSGDLSLVSSLLTTSSSAQRCRTNEILLGAMLPSSGRGLVIDLRSVAFGGSSGSSKTAKIEHRRHRDLAPITEANRPVGIHKRWPTRRYFRAADIDQYDQRWKRTSKPLPEIGEIFTIFGDFIQGKWFLCPTNLSKPGLSILPSVISDITRPTEFNPLQISTTYTLPGLLPTSNADLSSASRTISSVDEATSANGEAFAGVKVSIKKTSAWLSLVRDSLAVAVAGACALDGRDQPARQQLDREKALLTQKFSASSSELAELNERLGAMATQGAAVLIVGSGEGRDRSLLVSSLIQVILSPHARTIRGFESLIQREWVSSGHPFPDRCSHLLPPLRSSNEPASSSDCSPVFLLFLDCVWQILCQYPGSFEFTDDLLLLLAEHVYVSEFGTFLGDCDAARNSLHLSRATVSFWRFVSAAVKRVPSGTVDEPRAHSRSYVNSPEVLPKLRNVLFSPSPEDAAVSSTACWPCLAPQALLAIESPLAGLASGIGACDQLKNLARIIPAHHIAKPLSDLVQSKRGVGHSPQEVQRGSQDGATSQAVSPVAVSVTLFKRNFRTPIFPRCFCFEVLR
ncbi:unnamed protein product [Mesocestoides corti]|uniref:Myotubularin phosphatase domain-containing protein n=1 Tax=Mesocestoides corti TaxID=53468 RepID=A0A158QW98_MESCO|nr:unnamed protein product [Mesocestoides corti]